MDHNFLIYLQTISTIILFHLSYILLNITLTILLLIIDPNVLYSIHFLIKSRIIVLKALKINFKSFISILISTLYH